MVYSDTLLPTSSPSSSSFLLLSSSSFFFFFLLLLRDASRNRWHHTEVAGSSVIAWLPPNHKNNKRHRMSSAIQPLRKICCTFTAAYVRGPGFDLVADLGSLIQMIRLFHTRSDGLSLPCKRHFTTDVTKVICNINTVTRHH